MTAQIWSKQTNITAKKNKNKKTKKVLIAYKIARTKPSEANIGTFLKYLLIRFQAHWRICFVSPSIKKWIHSVLLISASNAHIRANKLSVGYYGRINEGSVSWKTRGIKGSICRLRFVRIRLCMLCLTVRKSGLLFSASRLIHVYFFQFLFKSKK